MATMVVEASDASARELHQVQPTPDVPERSPQRTAAAPSVPTVPVELSAGEPTDEVLVQALDQPEASRPTGTMDARLPSYSTVSGADEDVLQDPAEWLDLPPDYSDAVPEGSSVPVRTIDAKDQLQVIEDEEAVRSGSNEDILHNVPLPSEAGKVLWISAKGMHTVRLPIPSGELQIQVTNADGSVAYISTRAKRLDSTARLSKPGSGDLIQTMYGSQPSLTYLHSKSNGLQTFNMTGKNIRRNRTFRLPDGGVFEWMYADAVVNGQRQERLVLVAKDAPAEEFAQLQLTESSASSAKAKAEQGEKSRGFFSRSKGSDKEVNTLTQQVSNVSEAAAGPSTGIARTTTINLSAPGKIIAQLTRSEQVWQGKSSKKPRSGYRAGAGGELVLEPGCTDLVPEEVVVATALVMMKREQDRLRAVQTAVLVSFLLV